MTIDIEMLTQWSDPYIIDTKNGPTLVRKGRVTDEFWRIYKTEKDQLRRAGISVSKYNGVWGLTWWLEGGMTAPEVVKKDETDENLPQINEAGLLEWQIKPTARLYKIFKDGGNGALDASDTGVGKTYVACAVARELGQKIRVVCPLAVIPSWKRAADHIGTEIEWILNYEALKSSKGSKIINWGENWPEWRKPKGALTIWDEAHRCKSPKGTLNSKLLISLHRQGGTNLLCSATLAESPLHLRAAGAVLGLHNIANFWDWAEKYGARKNRWNGMEFNGDKAHLKRIHGHIFPKKGVRVRVSELGDKFPKSQITAESYNLGDIQKIYDEMEVEIARLEESKCANAAHLLALQIKARRQAELFKIPGIVNLVEDAIEEGNAVAVFLNYRDSVKAFCERVKIEHAMIDGSVEQKDRQPLIDSFQADRFPLMVCNIDACGTGVSFHGAKPRVAFISPTYSSTSLRQSLGRVWRAGGSNSIQKILFAADSIEEEICRRVQAKIANIDTINDGDLNARKEKSEIGI
jgi:hypothetical protein